MALLSEPRYTRAVLLRINSKAWLTSAMLSGAFAGCVLGEMCLCAVARLQLQRGGENHPDCRLTRAHNEVVSHSECATYKKKKKHNTHTLSNLEHSNKHTC